MKSVPKFQQSDSVDGLYKSSLFKNLFRDRKALFGDYPCASKGLVFPDPTLKSGTCSFSFKTNATVDKMTSKFDDREFQARYKKSTDKFDVSYKAKYAPGLFGLVKYEERGEESPAYVVGVDAVFGSLACNKKFNFSTGNLKTSMLYSADDILRSLKIGLDLKILNCLGNLTSPGDLFSSENAMFNIGACYASRAGLTALAFNSNKNVITLNHSLQVDKFTSGIVEVVVGTSTGKGSNPAPKAAIGMGYQVNKDTQVRARVNDAAQVQVCVKKDFTQSVSMLAACCVDLQSSNLGSQIGQPSIGFKLVNKV